MNRCHTRIALWFLSVLGLGFALPATPAQALPVIQQYVQISTSASSVNIDVTSPGDTDTPAPLTVKVAANFLHGGLMVSASPLVLAANSNVTLPANQLLVKGPRNLNYVPLTAPANVTGPMVPGIFSVPVYFRVSMPSLAQAGTYNGTITLTAAGAP